MSQSELQLMLNDWTSQLKPHFRPRFLQRNLTIYQFRFDQCQDPFHLIVTAEQFEFQPGEHPEPTTIMQFRDNQLCFHLLKGEADGMKAFMEGTYRANGHIVLSQLLLYLFRDQKQIDIYQVQD